ncbi:MAG: hypothetical protein UU16_C0041G0001 [Candidatus Woesebacteria bacterium GW2011_GWA2_40_7]|nr:MAG: hypothetical protein UU16_C0041G0001 [Candidatus Woesebacteria bacterium GW2011_GWA2_40_7]
MAFAVVKDTILNAAADKEEVAGAFDVMENVQRSLHRLGIADKDIPRTPHDIAEQVISLMSDFERIQQAKSKIDLQNNFQAFLSMSQRVFAGGKAEWNKLAPAQQRWMLVFGDTLLVRALQELGVGQETRATSETVMQIAENLSSMRREASWYTGAGRALQQLGSGAIGLIVDKEKGLIPGVVGIAGEIVEGIVDKTGDTFGRALDGVASRKKKE